MEFKRSAERRRFAKAGMHHMAVVVGIWAGTACKKTNEVVAPGASDGGTAEKRTAGPPDAAPAALPGGAELVGEKLVPLATDRAIETQLKKLVGPAAPSCAGAKSTLAISGYGDPKGRRWYGVRCDHRNGKATVQAYVVVAGFPDRPIVAHVTGMDSSSTVDAPEVYELGGGPMLCLDSSWEDEAQLREGWDTHCLREVGGTLEVVYSLGDTSLADGTTSAFEVIGGPPEEILDIVDCDDCEVCAIEDDCTTIPSGTQRYAKRLAWNGTTFTGPGERVRTGPSPASALAAPAPKPR